MIVRIATNDRRPVVTALPDGWWYVDLGGGVLEVGTTAPADEWVAAMGTRVTACHVVEHGAVFDPALFGGAVPEGWAEANVSLSHRAREAWRRSAEPWQWAGPELRAVWSAAVPDLAAAPILAAAEWLDRAGAESGGDDAASPLAEPIGLGPFAPEVAARLAHIHVVRLGGTGPVRESALLRAFAEELAAR